MAFERPLPCVPLDAARGAPARTEAEKVGGFLSNAVSELDVAVRKGVLHRKTASRLKSRISKTVNKAKKAVAK